MKIKQITKSYQMTISGKFQGERLETGFVSDLEDSDNIKECEKELFVLAAQSTLKDLEILKQLDPDVILIVAARDEELSKYKKLLENTERLPK